MPALFYILFFFLIGSCIGSFLNVVVYRLPSNKSLVLPPSHCPKCQHLLAWYDNIPVLGWIMLRGRCRYCRVKIAARYPLVEFFCGAMFVLIYWALFIDGDGPFFAAITPEGGVKLIQGMVDPRIDWPIFSLYLFTAAALLAASLIDFDLFIIPAPLPIAITIAGLMMHTLFDHRAMPGTLIGHGTSMALAAGGIIGLLISNVLLRKGILPLSFAAGESSLETEKLEHARKKDAGEKIEEDIVDYTPSQVRREILKELLFLLPPIALGTASMALEMKWPAYQSIVRQAQHHDWIGGLLGSLLGGMVGGLVIWLIRIFGSFAFGKEAMGLGDIDLMFAVGTVIGGFFAATAIFISPFFALPIALVIWLLTGLRQIPYGPYLSAATLFVMLFPFPFFQYAYPGLIGLWSAFV